MSGLESIVVTYYFLGYSYAENVAVTLSREAVAFEGSGETSLQIVIPCEIAGSTQWQTTGNQM